MPRYGYRVLRLRSEQPMKHWTQNQPYTKFALDFKPGDRVLLRLDGWTHKDACRYMATYEHLQETWGDFNSLGSILQEYLIIRFK